MRTLKRAVAITLALLLPSAVYGAIFGWTDSEGTAHYTNREAEIPPAYRDKAKLIVREPSDPQTLQQAGQPQDSPPSVAQSEPIPAGTAAAVSNPVQHKAGPGKGVARRRNRRATTEEE